MNVGVKKKRNKLECRKEENMNLGVEKKKL